MVDPHPKPWPLHPPPYEYEPLERWVRRLANAYGVSYAVFCRHALGLSLVDAHRLYDEPPEGALVKLAAGTGMPVDRLRQRTVGALLERCQRELERQLSEHEAEWAHWVRRWPEGRLDDPEPGKPA